MTLSGLVTGAAGTVAISDAGVLEMRDTSSIVAATTIAITDIDALTLGGLLSAPKIVVDNGSGTATVLTGTRIQTGGEVRPPGVVSLARLPSSATSKAGFFMTTGQMIQHGTLLVTSLPGTPTTSPSIVRIDSSGVITLDPSAGIVAPNSWLILGLGSDAKATGGIAVANLDAVSVGLAAGTALTGSVGGLVGNAAAGAANIAPVANSTFKINGCPIASVNCVLLTTQGIPAASPLRDFVIGSIFNPTDDDDLMLPLVSDEVY